MNSPLLPERDTLIVASEASSPGCLLESGFLCVRQGRYIEGLAFFALARERLSPDQMSLALSILRKVKAYDTGTRNRK